MNKEKNMKIKTFQNYQINVKKHAKLHNKYKNMWLKNLNKALFFLEDADRQDFISSYEEMIRDKVEQENISVVDAINSFEPIPAIANSIYEEFRDTDKIKKNESVYRESKEYTFSNAFTRICLAIFVEPWNIVLLAFWAISIFILGLLLIGIIAIPVFGIWSFFILETMPAAGIFVLSLFVTPLYFFTVWTLFSIFFILFREQYVFTVWIIDNQNSTIKKIRKRNLFNLYTVVKPKIWVTITIIFFIVTASLSSITFATSKGIFVFDNNAFEHKTITKFNDNELIEGGNNEGNSQHFNLRITSPYEFKVIAETNMQSDEIEIIEYSKMQSQFKNRIAHKSSTNNDVTDVSISINPESWTYYTFGWPIVVVKFELHINPENKFFNNIIFRH
ncbi:hypothetical protein ESOMN_v1c05790 [Williamsoniiplasma somnilux]|uniref:DUF1700 domain-containing protein n=1 Tax=Williamsoniiplasma somnilux TaxID=215578 RepID=A0A2K8P1S8_9MOLU|nr:hypothetical protein [Williamsoniiplasma somnilux]ATZ18961.1 hypothetical protein ESOMN_v1c05790 [Williamsoniiplasma somnilux]